MCVQEEPRHLWPLWLHSYKLSPRSPWEMDALVPPWTEEQVQSLILPLSISPIRETVRHPSVLLRVPASPGLPWREEEKRGDGNSPCKTWLWLNSFQLPWNLISFWTWRCRRQSHSWKAMSCSPLQRCGNGTPFQGPHSWGGRSCQPWQHASFLLLIMTGVSGGFWPEGLYCYPIVWT